MFDRFRSAVKAYSLVVLLGLAVGILVPAYDAFAQGGQAQAWGERSVLAWGVSVNMTTPNPSIGSPSWSGGPTAVRIGTQYPFIESGPTKPCYLDCGLHPYWSYTDNTGHHDQGIVTNVNLLAGGNYGYKSVYAGNNAWQAQFCSGSGCMGLKTAYLGYNYMNTVVSGGESSGIHWGSITSSSAQYLPYNGATWTNWCWSTTWINVSGGNVSNCSNYSWTSSY